MFENTLFTYFCSWLLASSQLQQKRFFTIVFLLRHITAKIFYHPHFCPVSVCALSVLKQRKPVQRSRNSFPVVMKIFVKPDPHAFLLCGLKKSDPKFLFIFSPDPKTLNIFYFKGVLLLVLFRFGPQLL